MKYIRESVSVLSVLIFASAAYGAEAYYTPVESLSALASTSGQFYKYPSTIKRVEVRDVGRYYWTDTCSGASPDCVAASSGYWKLEQNSVHTLGLGATGGTHQFVTQSSVGGALSAAQPAASDISGLATIATSGSASDLYSGTLPAARLPAASASALGGVNSKAAETNKFLTSIGTDGTVANARPSASDVSGLAASATTDTTNASNISSGTVGYGRLPAQFDSVFSTTASVSCSTDVTCALWGSVSVNEVTVSGVTGTARYVWQANRTSCTTDYIRPTGTSAGQFCRMRSVGSGNLYVVTDYGFDKTGATDNTTAWNNLLSLMDAGGGGTVYFPCGTYKFTSQVTFPVTGDYTGYPGYQSPFIVTGAAGQDVATNKYCSVLDLRYSSGGVNTTGRMFTRAWGNLEISNLAFTDLSSSDANRTPYIYGTTTRVNIHDNTFRNLASANIAAIVFGGTGGGSDPTNTAASIFGGYGSVIDHNVFFSFDRAWYFRGYTNSVTFSNNITYSQVGGITADAQVEGDSTWGLVGGVTIRDNVFHTNASACGLKFTNAGGMTIMGNKMADGAGSHLNDYCFYTGAGTNMTGNVVIASGTSYVGHNTLGGDAAAIKALFAIVTGADTKIQNSLYVDATLNGGDVDSTVTLRCSTTSGSATGLWIENTAGAKMGSLIYDCQTGQLSLRAGGDDRLKIGSTGSVILPGLNAAAAGTYEKVCRDTVSKEIVTGAACP